ncbi:MAG TPA: translocation/assembly module TamB domain-containing protein [bacterium]|nr:translocation/assembly module TamB domain-containing protein [bacterium]
MTPKNVKPSAKGDSSARNGRWPRWLRVGLKVLSWTVGSVLGLVVVAVIFLQTPFVKRWIIRTVEEALSEEYDADFSIGGLEGVLLTGATIRDVTISNPPGCKAPYFVVVKETDVEYNPFEMLAGEVRLRVARVVGAEVVLEEMPGDRLNVTEIFRRRGEETAAAAPLVVDDVRLVNAGFRFDFLDEGQSDLECDGFSGRVSLDLETGDVGLSGIDISGRTNLYQGGTFRVYGGMKVIEDGPIRFDGVTIVTSSSMVYVTGEMEPDTDRLDFDVYSPHFSLSELRNMGLGDLAPAGDTELTCRLEGTFTDPRARFTLKARNPSAGGYLLDRLELVGGYADGRLALEEVRLRRGGGRASGSATVDFSGERPTVEAALDFYGLDPAELAPLTLAQWPGDFNGRLTVHGGDDAVDGITAKVVLFPSRLRGVRINGLRLAGHGTPDDFVVTEGFLSMAGARINARGRFNSSGLAFTVDGRGVPLDRLAGLAGVPDLAGNLDFRAALEGIPRDLAARFEFLLTRGSCAGFTVGEARCSGNVRLTSTGEVIGLNDLLFELDARDAGYGENRVEQGWVGGALSLTDRPAFRGELRLAGITAAGRTFEELQGRLSFADDTGEIEQLHLVVDPETYLFYRGGFRLLGPGSPGTDVLFSTDLLHVVYHDFDILNSRPFVTELTEDGVKVEDVELVTAAGSVSLGGTYSFGDEELSARIHAPEVDLGALSSALGLSENPVSGLARLNLEVSGRPLEPQVNLELSLAGVACEGYHLQNLSLGLVIRPGVNLGELVDAIAGVEPLAPGNGDANLGTLTLTARKIGTEGFEVEHLHLDAELTGEEVRLVGLDASLVGGSLDAVGRLGLTTVERPLELYFGAYDFPLDELPFMPDTVEVEDGHVSAQGLVSGPVDRLQADGRVHARVKKLELYDYNVRLDNLAVELNFTPRTAELTAFRCLVGGGELVGAGTLTYGADRLSGGLKLTGRGLRVKNLADLFSGELNLEVDVETGPSGTSVTGLVEVVEGNVDLPLGESGTVAAGRPAENGAESSLRLDLRIVAEKNLWIRSDLAELEVGADLRLSLAGGDLALGGDLVTRRGSVYFLNKAFDLDSGTIGFDRMVPPDPTLSIRASSRMRRRAAGQTTEDLTLVVNVGGRLSEPVITLSCAEHPEWPERDVIMLVALDMTWDDYQQMLSEQGAGGATRHATGQAAFYLASFIETKLQRLAREAVGLDTLKIEGITESGDIDRLDITMGKYLFRDLYVSYSRDMLAEGNQSFSVEYFITDKLSLVGTTVEEAGEVGYDLNFRWKFKY